jgi:peroxiredoxin
MPLLLSAQTTNPTLTIKGELKNINDTITKVFLYYSVKGERKTDSSDVKDNKYSFAVAGVVEPTRAQIVAKNTLNPKARTTAKSYKMLFIEPGKITITNIDSFSNVKVKGSKSNDENEKLLAAAKPYTDQMKPLNEKFSALLKEGKKEEAKKVEDEIDALDEKMNTEVYGAYVKNNPTSPIALSALQTYAGYSIDADKVEPLFNQLPQTVQASSAGESFKAKLDIAKKLSIGKEALDFTQNDTLGNPVTLASLRGKYVLIDFWASWCGPCRRENPNVVKAFSKYKDKGFSIIGVSLDQPGAKEKWVKAIHDDNLTWTHVSDLQYWNNAVAKEYGVQAIPQNFLVDPKGVIVAKNLHGEELDKKLTELLK